MTEQTPSVQSAAPEAAPAQAAPAPAQPEATVEAQRPAWLPEKFKDAEQLAKAYAELEKRLGAPAQEQPKAEGPPSTAPTPEETLAVNRAGLDPASLADEFLTSGKVSDESYAKADKIGLSREFVDNFVAGQAALVQRQEAELFAEVGGAEEFKRVAAWARAHLTPREVKAIDSATQNQDLDLAKITLRGLYAKYQAAVGREPRLVQGESNAASAGYASAEEVRRAMADPRYTRDPAYRSSVEKRLQAGSPFRVRVGS